MSTAESNPAILLPAALPRRAWILGLVAVAVWIAASGALTWELFTGRPPWVSGGFCATLSFSLAWVLIDAPTAYRLEPGAVVIVTRVREKKVHCRRLIRVGRVGKDRFAINGGFGWFGWFDLEGAWVRAWVTDPAFAVRVETGGRDVLISPAAAIGGPASLGGGGVVGHGAFRASQVHETPPRPR